MSSSESGNSSASADSATVGQPAVLSALEIEFRDQIVSLINSRNVTVLRRRVNPILLSSSDVVRYGLVDLQDLRPVLVEAVNAMPAATLRTKFSDLATALGVELPAVTPPAVPFTAPPPVRPSKRPRYNYFLPTALAVAVGVSAALVERFVTAATFIDSSASSSSSSAMAAARSAFARVARKVSRESLQEGSYVLAPVDLLDADERPDAAAFVSSALMVFRVVNRSLAPEGSMTVRFVGVVGDSASLSLAPALPAELGPIRVGDVVSVPNQTAFLVATPELLASAGIGGDGSSQSDRRAGTLPRRDRTNSSSEDEDEDEDDAVLEALLGTLRVAASGGGSGGREPARDALRRLVAGGRSAGKDDDKKKDIVVDTLDGLREVHMSAVPKDKRPLVLFLWRSVRRAMDVTRRAALFQDGHIRYDALAVAAHVFAQATSVAHVAASAIPGATALPTHQIWLTAGSLREIAFLDVTRHRSSSYPLQHSPAELAVQLAFGPNTSPGRVSIIEFIGSPPASSLTLSNVRDAVRLTMSFLTGYLGVSYVAIANSWSEALSDPAGSMARLDQRYVLYSANMIMSAWYDQLSQASRASVLEVFQVDLSSPEGARDLLALLVNQGFRPTREGMQATQYLWEVIEPASAEASPAGVAPTMLFFPPTPPSAAAAASTPSYSSVPRKEVSFSTTLTNIPRRASPASLPASLVTPAAGPPQSDASASSVCWQFVGSLLGAKDKKGNQYDCRKPACPHQHVDSAWFRSRSKTDKLRLLDDWKVPAQMKADFARAIN